MKSYSERYVDIRKQLMEAVDDRLLKLDSDGWDRRIVPVDEVPEGELREAALWLARRGFDSVEQMISDMIWTLQEEIGADLVLADDTESLKIYCNKSEDGYWLPSINVVADISAPESYYVGNCALTDEYSKKCWMALSESDREYLESVDWDDLDYEDQMEIYSGQKYMVEITVNSDGSITLYHYNG